MSQKFVVVGGQAVIEGVMMRYKDCIATSVRLENGRIKTKKDVLKRKHNGWQKLPFVRGIVNLVDMLFIGTKTLLWSANQAVEEEKDLNRWEIIGILGLSFFFAMLIFVALPYILTDFFGVRETSNPLLFNAVDGIIKIAVFIIYIAGISLMKDVRRLFQYHGAEHKAVHCFEADKKLTVANVQKFSRLHPRCGTSFIMIVFLVSIFVFSIIPVAALRLFPELAVSALWVQKLILFPVRIAFIPLIAAIAYEVLKFSARHQASVLVKLIVLPGLGLQLLTTRQPDDGQVEVGIKALKAVL